MVFLFGISSVVNANVLKENINKSGIHYKIINCMLKTTLYLVLFSCFQIFGQVSTGKIEYSIETSKNDEIDKTFLSPKAKNFFNSMENFVKNYSFTLEFNNGISYCYSEQKGALISENENEILVSLKKSMLDIDNEYYFTDNKLYIKKTLEDNLFLILEDSISENWTLLNKTKKIGKYLCYKAIRIIKSKTSDNVYKLEVWYSPEISIPYGPKEFTGLPGLVLEAKRGNFVYKAKKIFLNPTESIEKITLPDYKITTEKEYEEINEKLKGNFMKINY